MPHLTPFGRAAGHFVFGRKVRTNDSTPETPLFHDQDDGHKANVARTVDYF